MQGPSTQCRTDGNLQLVPTLRFEIYYKRQPTEECTGPCIGKGVSCLLFDSESLFLWLTRVPVDHSSTVSTLRLHCLRLENDKGE